MEQKRKRGADRLAGLLSNIHRDPKTTVWDTRQKILHHSMTQASDVTNSQHAKKKRREKKKNIGWCRKTQKVKVAQDFFFYF